MKKHAGMKHNKGSKVRKSRRTLAFIGIGAALLAAVSALYFFVINPAFRLSDRDVLLSVNSEPVTWREYRRLLSNHRSEAYDYFTMKYNASDKKDFWKTSFNGEVPLEYIKEKTLKDVVRIKAEQILFKQYGILADIRYEAFLKSLSAENTRRAEAIKKGQAIYGPQQYGEAEYFSYTFSNAVIKLKEKLAGKDMAVSDQELTTYYETTKNLYKKEDYIKVQKISLSYVDTQGNIDKKLKDALAAQARKIKAEIDNGADFEAVSKGYDKAVVEEQVFDDDSANMDYKLNMEMKAMAQKLSAGQISDVFEANGAYNIMKCIDKKTMGFRSFDEVKELVRSKFLDSKYEQLVSRLVEDASVDINKEAYKQIIMQ